MTAAGHSGVVVASNNPWVVALVANEDEDRLNTLWLIVAGAVALVAAAFLLVLVPRLRREQADSLYPPKGAAAFLAGRQAPAIVAGVAIILAAGALFMAWQKAKPPEAAPSQIAQNGQMAPEHMEMIDALKARLEKNPDDAKGWVMLGRSYAVLGRYDESAQAYERAINLIPNNPSLNSPSLMVDYAEVLAIKNGRNYQGRPLDIVRSALQIDPGNPKGLLLIGKAAYQAGDFVHAAEYWEKLLPLLPPGSAAAKQISDDIAEAHAQASAQQK
jgi:cytochrome c-type biogenesis protein CcmH